MDGIKGAGRVYRVEGVGLDLETGMAEEQRNPLLRRWRQGT